MLGWWGDRILIFPPWKLNSLNKSSDVRIVFAFSLWQSCHSNKDKRSLQDPHTFSLTSWQNLPCIWHAAPLHFISVHICFGMLLCCAHLCVIMLTACMEFPAGGDTLYNYLSPGVLYPILPSECAMIKIIACFVKHVASDVWECWAVKPDFHRMGLGSVSSFKANFLPGFCLRAEVQWFPPSCPEQHCLETKTKLLSSPAFQLHPKGFWKVCGWGHTSVPGIPHGSRVLNPEHLWPGDIKTSFNAKTGSYQRR